MSRKPCPEDQEGEVVWDCGGWGQRRSPSPDYSNCSGLSNIQDHFTKLLDPEAEPADVIKHLNEDLDTVGDNLASGDIETVVKFLETATEKQKEKSDLEPEEVRTNNTENFVSMSVRAVDSLGGKSITIILQVFLGFIFLNCPIIFQFDLSLSVIENHI